MRAKSVATRVGRVWRSESTRWLERPCDASCDTCRSVSKTWWRAPLRNISSGSILSCMPESSCTLDGDPEGPLGSRGGEGFGLGHEAEGKGGVGLGKGLSVGE